MSGQNRRVVLKGALGAIAASVVATDQVKARAAARIVATPRRPLDFRPFEDVLGQFSTGRRGFLDTFIPESTVPQLQADLETGHYSGVELVAYYLDRIRRIDALHFHSVIDLNPEALEIAAAYDSERAAGRVPGPLHGIPVLVKDNIGTGDRLRTTAGAVALAAAHCDRDAHLIAGLREAGAIILGKTNLSEWSYWMAYYAPSGFSGIGGQVFSPYGDQVDPFGSSTGSAVAASLNLAAFAVGTETMGSIVAPSARAAVVGMKPTLGLVSRDRILPISDDCDSAGPIGRSVKDVAMALTAMAATPDVGDRHYPRAAGLHGTNFAAGLDTDALRGKRIGLIGIDVSGPASDDWIIGNSGLSDAATALRAAGARIVVLRPGPFELSGPGFVPEFNWGLREGVNAYLEATSAPVSSLAEIIRFNDENPGRFAPWGQERLRDCLWSSLSEREVRQIGASNRIQAQNYLTALLDGDDLDALVGIDTLQSMIYPFAGFPAIAVPGGTSWGAPFAVTFIGRSRSDAELLAMAYAFEQAARFRVPPAVPPFAGPVHAGGGARPIGTRVSWGFGPV